MKRITAFHLSLMNENLTKERVAACGTQRTRGLPMDPKEGTLTAEIGALQPMTSRRTRSMDLGVGWTPYNTLRWVRLSSHSEDAEALSGYIELSAAAELECAITHQACVGNCSPL
jgi:hypothetical protein